ncbi:kinase-like protein [Polychaeton citri CBS 116435]|uniref:non-specific serine/threonine protein kinase n=1 Tax=Polychaeton citri CBS 116435 TaxID=1314669 RepID=A0A9P4Q7V7_9PEZI|nr:kinase-like protein [Polychaeton citri CBS 116435]
MPPSIVEFSRLEVLSSFSDPTEITQIIPAEGRPNETLYIRERWRRADELGGGNWGIVYLQHCLDPGKSNKIRAVKEIRRHIRVDVNRELEAAALFSHHKFEKSFVKSFGWYETANTICLTMEHMDHGDLSRQLYGPLPEAQAQSITAQVVQGLVYMHEKGFAHRDLKPANILVHQPGPDWWVKLADFGFSKRAETGVSEFRSTVFTYTNAVDVWSAGVISFLLMTGKLPFPDNRLETYHRAWPDLPHYELASQNTSQEGFNFIQTSLSIEPLHRPTARDCLSHPWLCEQNGPWRSLGQHESPALPPRPG